MARNSRSLDWGFPRWRAYGESGQEAAKVRLCDRHGCAEPGNCPAPKAPNSPERWYFCEAHAAEYNRNWNYFQGLNAEYVARFGFPFIIAVRDNTKMTILHAFQTRIANDRETEFATACKQVERIAELRLKDMP